jgi:pilus assembly protein CpaF
MPITTTQQNDSLESYSATPRIFGRKDSLFPSKTKNAASATQQALTAEEMAAVPSTPDLGKTETANTNKISILKNPAAREHEQDEKFISPRLKKYQDIIWDTMKKTVDLTKFVNLDKPTATQEIMLLIQEIAAHHVFSLSSSELGYLCRTTSDEMLGFGPLELLLRRDEIDEIMVNGYDTVYVEINGKVEKSSVTFHDEQHLVAVCQRIANKVGRRVDTSSPICDARLQDGSRVNIILPPLALDGTILTIRKFSREKMTLERMIELGSVDFFTAELIRIIAACRVNILVSGGTGSGKTTMLNCLTRHISPRERIVTCEDTAELRLQQPHVLRLETRPANIEGGGEVTMRDLVKNCLRMRPERIIVGEVRSAEAFELLSAMNTGHDGSMGTIHANTPRDGLSRLENMIAMTGMNLPTQIVRQQVSTAVNVIIQIQRLRDGSRKVMSISEITGMEGDIIALQPLVTFQHLGENAAGMVIGKFNPSGLKPRFFDKLRQFNLEKRFTDLMESIEMTP